MAVYFSVPPGRMETLAGVIKIDSNTGAVTIKTASLLFTSLKVALISTTPSAMPVARPVGPILATYAGFIVSCVYNVVIIKKTISYRVWPLLKTLKEIYVLVIVMSLAVWAVRFLSESWLPKNLNLYSSSFLISTISIFTGTAIYLGIGLRLRIVKAILPMNKK